MEQDEFFAKFGQLPLQFASHVYGVPVTVEELYRQFAARFYAEQFGDKAPKLQAAGGVVRRTPRQRKDTAEQVPAPSSMGEALAAATDEGAQDAADPDPAESVETV